MRRSSLMCSPVLSLPRRQNQVNSAAPSASPTIYPWMAGMLRKKMAKATSKPRTRKDCNQNELMLSRANEFTSMLHHWRPSMKSGMLHSLNGHVCTFPAKADERKSSTSAIGCESIMLLATGSAICSSQLKRKRVRTGGCGSSVSSGCDKLTPFFLSAQAENGYVILLRQRSADRSWSACEGQIDNGATPAQIN